MPKVKISEYSTVNSNNTDINSINIDEGCAPSGINNAIREVMVHLKNWQTNASGDGATFASLVVQGTGSFTGAVTMSAGATLSGTNTLSGSNIMSGNINSSGTNTFSGSQVISGNINSSGTTNTFSGGNILSGTNTLSGSTIISGNFNATGTTNTFSNALILGNNLTFSGTGNRITGDFSNATTANRVTFKTSTTNGNTSLPIAPNGTGNVASIQLRSYDIDLNSNGNLLQIICSDAIGESRFSTQAIGSGTAMPMTFYTGGSERMRIDTSGNVGIGTSSPSYRLHVSGTAVGSAVWVNSHNTDATTAGATGGFFGSNGAVNAVLYAAGQALVGVTGTTTNHPFLLYTNGTERMRIDSSGNVGIGTSSPSTYGIFAVQTSTSANTPIVAITNSVLSPQLNHYITDSGSTVRNLNQIGFNTGSSSSANYQGFMTFSTMASAGGTISERMRITSGGDVGIGTSSPTQRLHISGSSGITRLRIESTGSVASSINFTTTSDANGFINYDTGAFLFFNNSGGSATERMRITSGGEVYIAGTTDQGAYNLQCNGTGVWGAGAYVNGSDARIKEDVAPIDSGLDVVEKLNPVTYRYKEDWSKDQSVQTGFIAQELLVALDGKNYVDGIVQQGGAEGYYSVAYQNIIPILTKAIQELSAKNAALEARIAALESN